MSKQKVSKKTQTKPELYTVLGFVEIKRDHFIDIMDSIEKQHDYDIMCSGYANKLYADAFEANLTYNNSHLQNALFQIIQMAFNDEHAHSWIEYYCWELHFGTGYVDGCVKRKDGTIVDLSDAGKLYDYLNEA